MQRLQAAFSGASIETIYTSPLLRAKQTADILRMVVKCPTMVDERLIEQDFGSWEGLHIDEVKVKYALDFANWTHDARQYGPTNGETSEEVRLRQSDFLEQVKQTHMGKTVIVVGHGSGINALLCDAMGTPLRWRWAYHLLEDRIPDYINPEGSKQEQMSSPVPGTSED